MNKKLLLSFPIIFVVCAIVLQTINPAIPKGTIMGNVAPAESGIRVQVIHDNMFVAETTTDGGGNYRILNLQPLKYGLIFINKDKAFIYNDGNMRYTEASTINVTDTIDLESKGVANFDINLSTETADFVADTIRVRFKENVTGNKITEIITSQNCTIKEIIKWSFLGERPVYDLTIPYNKTVVEIVEQFKQIQEIERATSYNFVYGGGY